MSRLILQRILWAVPTLWVLATLIFFLLRAAPGGPFDGERALPPQTAAALQTQYQLDAPLMQQYVSFLTGILRGDLGISYQYPDFSVTELIRQALPVSLWIGSWALLLALALGVGLGALAARAQGTWIDRFASAIAALGLSVPVFVIAPALVLVFAVSLGLLPAGGWPDFWGGHLVLPVVTLALPLAAAIARLARTGFLRNSQSLFVRAAVAKGMDANSIWLKHILRPGMLPVVAYLGPAAAALLTGSVVVETIYGLPGLGRYFVQGAMNRDYTLVSGVVLCFGMLVLVFSLLSDVAVRWIDPRTVR